MTTCPCLATFQPQAEQPRSRHWDCRSPPPWSSPHWTTSRRWSTAGCTEFLGTNIGTGQRVTWDLTDWTQPGEARLGRGVGAVVVQLTLSLRVRVEPRRQALAGEGGPGRLGVGRVVPARCSRYGWDLVLALDKADNTTMETVAILDISYQTKAETQNRTEMLFMINWDVNWPDLHTKYTLYDCTLCMSRSIGRVSKQQLESYLW